MENIFENAKFGDKFKTKDGRCAILVNWGQWREKAYLYVEERDIEFFGEAEYNLDGSVIKGNHSHDIIGKWEEPIDEEKLTKMANEYMLHPDRTIESYALLTEMMEAFKAGYRKAKEE